MTDEDLLRRADMIEMSEAARLLPHIMPHDLWALICNSMILSNAFRREGMSGEAEAIDGILTNIRRRSNGAIKRRIMNDDDHE
jgi:hypothetical protein